METCTRCNKKKSSNDFYHLYKNGQSKITTICKLCHQKYQKEKYREIVKRKAEKDPDTGRSITLGNIISELIKRKI